MECPIARELPCSAHRVVDGDLMRRLYVMLRHRQQQDSIDLVPRDIGLGRNAWWDKPPFNYPHTLISYVRWQQPFKFPSGSYVFGDSGGFTLRSPTRSLKIDPLDVLHWQASQCSVGCLLDVPPGIKQRIWDRALSATIDHTKRALPHYERMRALARCWTGSSCVVYLDC